jgi:excisionase family DNA binding protein
MASKTNVVTAYNLTEAARRIGISRSTIHRAVRDGKLPVTHVGKRSVVVYSDDLLDYVLTYRRDAGLEA